MNPEFWRGKRVFVTGHTGFRGSWLSLWLQDAGAKVTGYALPPATQPSMFELCQVAQGMKSVLGDVRDPEQLHRVVAAGQPEIVIHMAAQPPEKSREQPVETFQTNVFGTIHLLEAVRRTPGVRAVVVVTSDQCYKNHQWYWSYREKSQLGGDDPNSSSQACAELAFAAYAKTYFNSDDYEEHKVALATARAGHVIGGGDWAKDQLVPDTMRALVAGQPIAVRNPQAVRSWQHVLEPLNGFLVLAEHLYDDGPRCNGHWNFGPSETSEKPAGWIVEQIYGLWGASLTCERDSRGRPEETVYLKLDASKARALLGWRPQLEIETTLSWIVEWTKELELGANMRTTTLDQIRRFTCVAKGVFSALALAVGF